MSHATQTRDEAQVHRIRMAHSVADVLERRVFEVARDAAGEDDPELRTTAEDAWDLLRYRRKDAVLEVRTGNLGHRLLAGWIAQEIESMSWLHPRYRDSLRRIQRKLQEVASDE